ncbi:hypothetical protein AB0M28_10880 [Streptomyces sp. NPDC051940]|uniref:hypothetical protein n=1 Tax=Streptomyces sp. NPDC051940 TaxID=3155675 RepID=UPI00344028D7
MAEVNRFGSFGRGEGERGGSGALSAGVAVLLTGGGLLALGVAAGRSGSEEVLVVVAPLVVGLIGVPALGSALLRRGRGGTGVMTAAVLGLAAAVPADGERVPYPLVAAVGLAIVGYLVALQAYAARTWRAVHWPAALGAVAVLLAASALSAVPVPGRAWLLALGVAAVAGAFAVAVGRAAGSGPRPTGWSRRR